MFESLVASLLNRFLGAYIENFDSKQLNIGIWGGDVRLKNLRLKKESLDKFKLPLDVKFGHLGELTLLIPWNNLKGKPVKVVIDDVYLLASPMILNDYDQEEDSRREQALKQERLKDYETMQSALTSNDSLDPNSAANESFTESLVTKIIDNLQVTIKNIHIRYEDDSVLTQSPYSLGVTLEELSAQSTNANWEPSFILITQSLSRKLLLLRRFAVYMNTESPSLFLDDPDELLSALKLFFKSPQEYQFLLKPVSGEGHLTLHKTGATEAHPHIQAQMFFEEFGLDFESSQYRDILWTASKFHWFQKTWKFRKLRPKDSVLENPREWLHYTVLCVLNEIHEKNYRWSWDHFKKRRDQRKSYIALWRKKLLKNTLSESEQAEFNELENALTYEDIKFYRSITRNQIRKDNLSLPADSTAKGAGGGWLSGWWGGKNKNAETTPELNTTAPTDEGGLNLTLTDEQRKAFYDTIDFDETQVSQNLEVPRETITMEVLVNLKRAALLLKTSKEAKPLAEVIVEGCSAQFYERPDSFLLDFQLDEFKVEDGTTDTLYKHVVSVKHMHTHSDSHPLITSRKEPFFKVSFENNPLDGSADTALTAQLKSMTIFYNRVFVDEVIRFFKPPKIHLDTVGAIMNAAEATMEGFTSQTRMGLEYALEEHKTINLQLDLQAPLVILPLDPTSWKSSVAILDAGHISVTSDLVDKSTIEEVKAKDHYSESDWKRLKTLMYDKFSLRLQNSQLLVGPSIKKTMEQLHTTSELSAVILDNLDLKLALELSILPGATNLARIRLSGEVPNINVALNDFQYKTIMKLIDVVIPNLDFADEDEEDVFNALGHVNEESSLELTESVEIKKSEKKSEQHMFELDFKIGQVNLSLSRCVNGTTLEAEHIVDLVGDSLKLGLFKTDSALHLDLSLNDINVIDHIEKNGVPEFEKLLSSNNFLPEEAIERKHPELFKVDYTRTQRIVDYKQMKIEVFDQDIIVDMSAVKLVVSRMSYLSMLNFVLNTFVDPNAPETPADQLKHNDVNDEDSPQKINVLVNLDSIVLVLNEDGLKLATMQLGKANIEVLVLPEELEVRGSLGALSLHDESNHGSARDSMFRSLVAIEGENLAKFRYKAYDSAKHQELHQSLIDFETAAIKINFVEDAFGKIFRYLSKFQKMKEIYDTAREAAIDQRNSIEGAGQMKLNILVRAPTIHFPKLSNPTNEEYDVMVAELGELFLNNEFKSDQVVHNLMKAGIRNVNLFSQFHFVNGIKQHGQILNDLDISFEIDYVEEYCEAFPHVLVVGNLPTVDLKLTELQANYMYNLQNLIIAVFGPSDEDNDSFVEIEYDAKQANAVMKHNQGRSDSKSLLKKTPAPADKEMHSDHEQMVVSVDIPRISLTLYHHTKGLESFEEMKLISVAVTDLGVSFKMTEDSNFISDMAIRAFTVTDVREGTSNQFREILPPLKGDKPQFNVNLSSSDQNSAKTTTAVVTVEKPKVVLALDCIVECQAFVESALVLDKKVPLPEESDSEDESDESVASGIESDEIISNAPPAKFGFSVNVVQPSVILLADSEKTNSEAIVFKVEQVLVTSQNIVSLAANEIGMFIVKMDEFDGQRIRIIDDFSISFALDERGLNAYNYLTNIQLSLDPLLFRISLRDIRLAVRIANRASELYQKAIEGEKSVSTKPEVNFSEEFKLKLSRYAPSLISSISNKSGRRRGSAAQQKSIIKGEEFSGSFGGARLVFIGDVHELPVLDLRLEPFEAKVLNWSSDLSAEVHIQLFVNIYNYSKLTWEPLLEPWPISVYALKATEPKPKIMVDVISRELAQISVSSRSVALISQFFDSLTSDHSLTLREEVTPYVIKNETGHDLEVWIDRFDELKDNATFVKRGEEIDWSFEDWRTIRENLDVNSEQNLAVKFMNSSYEVLRGLRASSEGEEIFTLNPSVNGVHNRLACVVKLREDNVKVIYLRSTVTVRNDSETSIDVQLVGAQRTPHAELTIEPNSSMALPIDHVHEDMLRIRPHMTTKFNWSLETVFWADMRENGDHMTCSSIDEHDLSLYYFKADAEFDPNEPLGKIYPHLTVVISAPLEVENLLPFDMGFRLYDKTSKKDWSGEVATGSSSFVHVVNLKSLLLLSVEPLDCGFGKSEFAIINSVKGSEFKREDLMSVKHEGDHSVRLRMHYSSKKNTGLKVLIYSPYVVLNRTGQDLAINENKKINALVRMGSKHSDNRPHLFSFDEFSNPHNRAVAKLGDSVWSKPLSFDAIGQETGVRAQISGKQAEMCFGVSIAEGEGKFQLTKVVTFVPRYVLRNNLSETLLIVENGSTSQFELQPGELTPLHSMRKVDAKSICIKFAHNGKGWSSPFNIDDIGQVFLKMQKEDQGQKLIKANVITEKALIFIQIEDAKNEWPFSIRNFTEQEFFVYQGNPNVNSDGEVVKNDIDFKPVFYRVPPRSVMPYAYDYPNAVVRELVIRARGRERVVNLAEIGNLQPFRLPANDTTEQFVADLNVIADGPTQSLVISKYDPSVSLYKLQNDSGAVSDSKSQFQVEEKDENYFLKVITRFEGFGISLINTRSQELCYITMRGVEVRYNESLLYQNLSLKLKWVQVDNQLYGGIFPIIIYPTVVPKSGKEMNTHPSFSAAICKVKDDTHGVVFIKYATALLQEMSIEVDEDFLFALLDFSKFPGASWNKVTKDSLCSSDLDIPQPETLSGASDIYFEALHLQPALTNLSFVRTERVNADDRTSSLNTLMFFVNVLTMAIGNINDAPIKLNALLIENVRSPIPILLQSVSTHYGQSFFYQVHKILGSADFLGNPVGLFNNLSSGVLDIFYEPYQGFILNDRPQELGIGLAKGGLSFLKKSVYGFSDSFAKVTGSLAKGLSVATMDRRFQERRRLNQRRNRPKHALYGFTSGANLFFESVSSGVTGVARDPMEGIAKEGAGGFFKGLGKGVIGLPTKTAIGLFDLASNVGEGIRNTTTVFDNDGLEKVRLPRYISYDGIIRPYCEREAQGQFWLKSLDGGKYFGETYLAHLVLPGEEMVVLVTFEKIILFVIHNLSVKWNISFSQVRSVSLELTGITITLDNKRGPFVPVPEKNLRNFLYGRLKVAVERYNQRCRVSL